MKRRHKSAGISEAKQRVQEGCGDAKERVQRGCRDAKERVQEGCRDAKKRVQTFSDGACINTRDTNVQRIEISKFTEFNVVLAIF